MYLPMGHDKMRSGTDVHCAGQIAILWLISFNSASDSPATYGALQMCFDLIDLIESRDWSAFCHFLYSSLYTTIRNPNRKREPNRVT